MSFSLEAKIEAAAFAMKKPCCRRAFINGVMIMGADVCDDTVSLYVESEAVAEICTHIIKEQFGRETEPQKVGGRGIMLLQFASGSASKMLKALPSIDVAKSYKCAECQSAFLRGIFVAGGTVSEPQKKDYHIEFKSRMISDFSYLSAIFSDAGFELKASTRLGKESLYAKDSGTIGDFLFYIGANKQAFDFMNAKISHEIKNDINRRTNCETSNIARATASAAKHITAIKYLLERGRLSELGPELEYTANMRLKYPEMSLVQLGQTMTPAVSKPGLYHRLEKIYVFSETLKNKEI